MDHFDKAQQNISKDGQPRSVDSRTMYHDSQFENFENSLSTNMYPRGRASFKGKERDRGVSDVHINQN